jgi:lipopolysaccharide export system protein LptC
VQVSAATPVVEMKNLVGNILLSDGPAKITAPTGNYNFDTGQVAVPGPVKVTATDGYRMVTNGVGIDLKARKLAGAGGVSGTVPSGVFSADRMSADLGERTVTLEGRAHLRMTPGKLRMPQ